MKQSYWVTCEVVVDYHDPVHSELPTKRRLAHEVRRAQLDLDTTYVVKNITITKDGPTGSSVIRNVRLARRRVNR